MSNKLVDISCRLVVTVSAVAHPLRSAIRKLFGDVSGNAAIEYALTVGGIGIMGVGGASLIGAEASQIFDLVGLRLCQAVNNVCVIWQ